MPDIPDPANTAPDLIIDGHRIFFVWHQPTPEPESVALAPTIPMGVLIEHTDRMTLRGCIAWVPWVDTGEPGAAYWTLLSLHPLSIAEPFSCSRCNALGGIRDGRWWLGLNTR